MMRTAVYTAHLHGGPQDGAVMTVGAVRRIVFPANGLGGIQGVTETYRLRVGTAALVPGRLDYDWAPE